MCLKWRSYVPNDEVVEYKPRKEGKTNEQRFHRANGPAARWDITKRRSPRCAFGKERVVRTSLVVYALRRDNPCSSFLFSGYLRSIRNPRARMGPRYSARDFWLSDSVSFGWSSDLGTLSSLAQTFLHPGSDLDWQGCLLQQLILLGSCSVAISRLENPVRSICH